MSPSDFLKANGAIIELTLYKRGPLQLGAHLGSHHPSSIPKAVDILLCKKKISNFRNAFKFWGSRSSPIQATCCSIFATFALMLVAIRPSGESSFPEVEHAKEEFL